MANEIYKNYEIEITTNCWKCGDGCCTYYEYGFNIMKDGKIIHSIPNNSWNFLDNAEEEAKQYIDALPIS